MKELIEGDVIRLTSEHKVYAEVPKHFIFANCKGNFELHKSDVHLSDFEYLCGDYIVERTALEGGSTGRDAYPNGHHVYCFMVSNPEIKIDFYQSGYFTAMIKDIEPIGRALKEWVYNGEMV